MTEEKEKASQQFEKLRREAEEKLDEAIGSTEGMSKEEAPPIKELLHELQVHQVELELQNEELRETRNRLRKAKERYADLYDSAPVSYMTLNEEGEILDANLTATEKLRTERKQLSQKNLHKYVAETDRDTLFKHLRKVFKTEKNHACELTFIVDPDGSGKKGEQKFYGLLQSTVFRNDGGELVCRTALSDITDEKQSKRELRQSFVELAETTSRVLGVRDPYTQKHELSVGELARAVGERMDLGEDKLLGLYIGGVLHDIGKIAVPETILTKPGELKDVEWEMIKSHPKVGYNQILEDTDFPWPVAEMTLHHHERLDGSGYPDGLEGDELTTEVRILGAVDVVEAMSTRRPYREARTKERTLRVIKDGKGDKFDPEVVDILIEMIGEGVIEFG